MPELRVGHDYHLAEVKRAGVSVHWYEASCDACGWIGPKRDTRAAADDDAIAHDTTENE